MIKAKKSLGQNFLIDGNIIDKITNIVEIKNKSILEVGPGTGNLTSSILKKNPRKILVVEKDDQLAKRLKENFNKEITIINGDILKINENLLCKDKLIVFGNLPYNISTEILCKWILNLNDKKIWFKSLILMFQKEVADRSDTRLKLLKENLERLDIKSVKTLKVDATKLIEIMPQYIDYFDKILIDAPCSGLGTLARNPDARWKITKESINQLITIQEKLLENIVPLLNKNGLLVYSTCTICPSENNLLIEKFLKKNKNLQLVFEKQILPNNDDLGDGFYAAIVSKKN